MILFWIKTVFILKVVKLSALSFTFKDFSSLFFHFFIPFPASLFSFTIPFPQMLSIHPVIIPVSNFW
jgi:hypothetical protein